jgi:ubiquinone/menaquinone biosynthesis C-methylase UbiE
MPTPPDPAQQDASVATQYDAWARVYDVLWSRYMNQTLPVAQRAAAVTPGERVLDLACGTGELLHRMAQETPEADLTGIDLAPKMIKRARHKLAGRPGVALTQADAHDLPFGDNAFDVLVCANTFHYFTHPEQVVREAHRVLSPDGRLVVLDWCRDFWTCRVMDALLQYIDPAHTTCYTLDELTALLERASFAVPAAGRYRFDLVWGMMVVTAMPSPNAASSSSFSS